MNDNFVQRDLQTKKKGNGFILFIIAILFLGIGIGVGLGVSKLLVKDDSENTDTKEEVKEKEESTTTQESTYKKPEPRSDYKLLKEDTKEVKISGNTVHFLTYYYWDENGYVFKDTYSESNKIVEDYMVALSEDDLDDGYKDDVKMYDENVFLKDTANNEEYYFFKSSKLAYDGFDMLGNDIAVHLIDKNGKEIFSSWLYSEIEQGILHFKTKEAAGDRTVEYDEENKDYDAYNGNLMDIHENYFYELGTNEDCEVLEYKYTVSNGELKKVKVAEYEEGIAGQC